MSLVCFKFDEFELDARKFELRHNGRAIKIERVPLELLLLLVGKNGDLVSRQEIADRLWGNNVFVDADQGINTAIRKVRAALGEDSERFRFIQTVSGKGYRFVAEVVCTNGEPPIADLRPVESQNPPATGVIGGLDTRETLPWFFAVICLALVAVLGLAYIGAMRDRLLKPNVGSIHTIAVLPLVNLSGDASQNYYADGMTDELITALARNRSLRVISRTSVMQFKNVSKPLRDIAQALGADGILEGSVTRSGNRVHLNLQLIYAPTDTHVWAGSFDRDLNGAMNLPDELSPRIAAEAKAEPTPAVPKRYVSPEAHDAYLQGRFYWFVGDYNRAMSYFEQAANLQPDYAAAWDGIGDAIAGSTVDGSALPSEAFPKYEEYARKALALDDSLPEAHNSLAAIYLFYYRDWGRAEQESRRSIQLNPNFAEGHHALSYILFAQNRDEEALQEQKLSTDLDPLTRPWALGQAYIHLRRFDAAIDDLRVRAQFRRDFWIESSLSEAYLFKGMDQEAANHLAQAFSNVNDQKSAAAVKWSFKENGWQGVSEWMLHQQLSPVGKKHISPWSVACWYANLKRKDQTLAALEDAYQQRTIWLVFLQKEPVFDFLHSDPRYRALVRKIGLPFSY